MRNQAKQKPKATFVVAPDHSCAGRAAGEQITPKDAESPIVWSAWLASGRVVEDTQVSSTITVDNTDTPKEG